MPSYDKVHALANELKNSEEYREYCQARDAAFEQLPQKYCAVCRLHAGDIYAGAFAASFGRTTDGTDLICVRSVSL